MRLLDSLATVLFAHMTLEHVSHELRKWRLNHHRALLDVVLSPRELDIQKAIVMHLRMSYPEPERFSSLATPAMPLSARLKRKVGAAVKLQGPLVPSHGNQSHGNKRGRRRGTQRANPATRMEGATPVDLPGAP